MNNKVTYSAQGETFVVQNYNRAKTFANFFASIAGETGIPLWVFYVNRAQGICAFGLKDKDHAFLEFQPANKAYQTVGHIGFRTFCILNGKQYEPFREDAQYRGVDARQDMYINAQDLTLVEENKAIGLKTTIDYSLIVEESFPGLVRKVTFENISRKALALSFLDGLSNVVMYPQNNWFLKEMSCTIQAWALAEELKNDTGHLFRLKVDPADVSYTRFIDGGNLYASVRYHKGKAEFLPLIVDPDAVFGEEKGLNIPAAFYKKDFSFPRKQIREGKSLCSFTHARVLLKPGQSYTFYSLAASLEDRMSVGSVTRKMSDPAFFTRKHMDSRRLIQQVKDAVCCVSGDSRFDAYLAQSFLDNVLRGGMPMKLVTRQRTYPYYIYSRKHGDLERDYNRFVLTPNYFSEGEANFRDINQNRRMDPFIFPYVDDENILSFFNLQRVDGYNPLLFRGVKYSLRDGEPAELLPWFETADPAVLAELQEFLHEPFYFGEMSLFLRKKGLRIKKNAWQGFCAYLLENAKRHDEADFGEGFWIDHFTYNADLLESYEAIYPDRMAQLIFHKVEFTFWDDAHKIKPRSRRYVVENETVFQLHSLEVCSHKKEVIHKRKKDKYVLHTQSGRVYKTTLAAKMLILILNKLATLDPFGLGIEMEADKPGWCDSLNGLPALFGSSLPETAELKRLIVLLLRYCEQFSSDAESIVVPEEISDFFAELERLVVWYADSDESKKDLLYWDKANLAKEHFREIVANGFKDQEQKLPVQRVIAFLKKAAIRLAQVFKRSRYPKSLLYKTYFINTVTKHRVDDSGAIIPIEFTQKTLPLYLEGQVRMLKIEEKTAYARRLCQALKKSPLYDTALGMYRLNASLKDESFYIGRSRVFPPGWLENESIWLHMEYKYLVELLRLKLYPEFDDTFKQCGICFQEPEQYGRSIFENSSFIVSSAHSDKKLWGRGFVARLSGSTAEMVTIFLWMAAGQRPFFLDNGRLHLRFAPYLKKEWFTKQAQKKTMFFGQVSEEVSLPAHTFSFKFLGETVIVYHNPARKDLVPGKTLAQRILLDQTVSITGGSIGPAYAEDIRRNRYKRIDIYFD